MAPDTASPHRFPVAASLVLASLD